jgi:hypothetical protein
LQEFELVLHAQNWHEDRVWLHDANDRLRALPANWTNIVGEDPFNVVAAGRASDPAFRQSRERFAPHYRHVNISQVTLYITLLDEDGVYDPAHFNDRLLLGLKGTMSEAELHVLRARLQGGILSKARHGELEMRLPVGFIYNPGGVVVLDPDQQVQHCLRWLFDTFRGTGSAMATARAAHHLELAFPRRCGKGLHKGELLWGSLGHSQVVRILHNPRYAGAFVYGRSHTRKTVDGRTRVIRVPRDQWDTLIPGAHAGYLSWEEYEQNQKRLHESAQAIAADRRRGAPREGPALLQGLVVCGRCGNRMTVRYHSRQGRLCPEYICQREGIEQAEPVCQRVFGGGN